MVMRLKRVVEKDRRRRVGGGVENGKGGLVLLMRQAGKGRGIFLLIFLGVEGDLIKETSRTAVGGYLK